ncbi:MAG: ribulose-phosphate 3-epimerase [Puniceicoccales bacterium]|jgi:ribulose-phosphate 3-epimerase|nr:ribulose-phosphate 3-epimerase [Puniceicoccales bacterium]
MAFPVPSLLACDHGAVWDSLEPLLRSRRVHRLHFDAMDGHFVPNFGFSPQLLRDLDSHIRLCQLPRPRFDVHLMVQHPEKVWPIFWEAGADGISFHGECCPDPLALARELRALGLHCAMALRPESPLELALACGPLLDELLLLGVSPGFGGQPAVGGLVERVERAAELRRERNLNFSLAVDGGVNRQTLGPLAAAGMDIPIAGSAILGQDDPVRALAELGKIFEENRLPSPGRS